MVNDEQWKAIGDFFMAIERLKTLKVIRSDRYLGDIAEFIATSQFGLILATSCRERGHDGYIDDKKVEIKFNGGSSKTITVGNPDTYDELIVVLGPNSIMRASSHQADYVIYRFPSEIVKQKAPHRDGKRRFAKGDLQSRYCVC